MFAFKILSVVATASPSYDACEWDMLEKKNVSQGGICKTQDGNRGDAKTVEECKALCYEDDSCSVFLWGREGTDYTDQCVFRDCYGVHEPSELGIYTSPNWNLHVKPDFSTCQTTATPANVEDDCEYTMFSRYTLKCDKAEDGSLRGDKDACMQKCTGDDTCYGIEYGTSKSETGKCRLYHCADSFDVNDPTFDINDYLVAKGNTQDDVMSASHDVYLKDFDSACEYVDDDKEPTTTTPEPTTATPEPTTATPEPTTATPEPTTASSGESSTGDDELNTKPAITPDNDHTTSAEDEDDTTGEKKSCCCKDLREELEQLSEEIAELEAEIKAQFGIE